MVFFIRLESVGLRDGGSRRVLQNMIVTCIDAGIAFDALTIDYFSIEVKNLTTDVNALEACITTITTACTLCHTREV